MDSIAKYMSEENDIFFIRGKEKGAIDKATTVAANLLLKTDLSIHKIAIIIEETERFVKQVKKSFKIKR